ncbi:MAG: selenocysteine-specific translation elongation factor [Raoultibacter sp.]
MGQTSHTSRILGTAGHIDHGKSSLVKALTGTDPDRLKEEKARGITIEPGFAQLILPDGTSVGMVDVPGHEKFVRHMIAGSSGIDIALLCIAADDGIMPQTIEHLAVLDLLGIPQLIVALTKSDLVDDDWKIFIEGEITAFLAETPYQNSPIIPFSSKTGEGTVELTETIQRFVHTPRDARDQKPVRYPIDRVFTIKGSGTVVTGTLWQGSIQIDDELEVLPSGKRARVRSLQSHGVTQASIEAGTRVALNLSNVKTDEIRPGDFLATPTTAQTTDRFDACFTYYDTSKSGKPLKTGSRVHVAHGTREVLGRLLLMDGRESMSVGERGYIQIRLDEPLPVMRGDHYIIRSYSPVSVIGGGVVLLAAPKRRTHLTLPERALLDALMESDDKTICAAALKIHSGAVRACDLERLTGLHEDVLNTLLLESVAEGSLELLEHTHDTYFATRSALQKCLAGIENNLLSFHAKNPTAPGIQKAALLQLCRVSMDQNRFDALLAELERRGGAIISNGEVSHPKAGAGAKMAEAKAQDALESIVVSHGKMPPSITDLIAQSGIEGTLAHRALNTLENDGKVQRIGNEFYFSAEAFNALKQSVALHFKDHACANAAELKEAMGISRKYAIPLLEHFDATGFTQRTGDTRELRNIE